nr:hypothetical protein [uncultured Gellertiella sp.]
MPDKITVISLCWMTLMGVMFAALFTLGEANQPAMQHSTSRDVTAHS